MVWYPIFTTPVCAQSTPILAVVSIIWGEMINDATFEEWNTVVSNYWSRPPRIWCSRTPYKNMIKIKKVMGLVLVSVHLGLLKHPQSWDHSGTQARQPSRDRSSSRVCEGVVKPGSSPRQCRSWAGNRCSSRQLRRPWHQLRHRVWSGWL